MKKSYALLTFCSLIPVLFCFYIAYYAMTEDVGLGGLVLALVTYLLWIPGAFFSAILHILLQVRLNFPRLPVKRVFIIAMLINMLGMTSFWITLKVVESGTQYVMKNAPLTATIVQDNLIPNNGYVDRIEVEYLYEYTISVINSGTVTLKDVPTRITLGYVNQNGSHDDGTYYTSVIMGNEYTRISFPPGETIVRDTIPVFSPTVARKRTKGLPLRVEMYLNVDEDTVFQDRQELYVAPGSDVESQIRMLEESANSDSFQPIQSDLN